MPIKVDPLSGAGNIIDPNQNYDEKTAERLFIEYLTRDEDKSSPFVTQFIDWFVKDHDNEQWDEGEFDKINRSAFSKLLQKSMMKTFKQFNYATNPKKEAIEFVREIQRLSQDRGYDYTAEEQEETYEQVTEQLYEMYEEYAELVDEDKNVLDITLQDVMELNDTRLYAKFDPTSKKFARRYDELTRSGDPPTLESRDRLEETLRTIPGAVDPIIETDEEGAEVKKPLTVRKWLERNVDVSKIRDSRLSFSWDMGLIYYGDSSSEPAAAGADFSQTIDLRGQGTPLRFDLEAKQIADLITGLENRLESKKLRIRNNVPDAYTKQKESMGEFINEIENYTEGFLTFDNFIEEQKVFERLDAVLTEGYAATVESIDSGDRESFEEISEFIDSIIDEDGYIDQAKEQILDIMSERLASSDASSDEVLEETKRYNDGVRKERKKMIQRLNNLKLFLGKLRRLFMAEGMDLNDSDIDDVLNILPEEMSDVLPGIRQAIRRMRNNPTDNKLVNSLIRILRAARKEMLDNPREVFGPEKYDMLIFNKISRSKLSPLFTGTAKILITKEGNLNISFDAVRKLNPEIGSRGRIEGRVAQKVGVADSEFNSSAIKIASVIVASGLKEMNAVRSKLIRLNGVFRVV